MMNNMPLFFAHHSMMHEITKQRSNTLISAVPAVPAPPKLQCIAKNTLLGHQLKDVDVNAIRSIIQFLDGEVIEVIHSASNHSSPISRDTMVCCTNQRLFKIKQGKVSKCVARNCIMDVEHVKGGIFARDQIKCRLISTVESFGIYEKDACQYLCHYLLT
jgi:hypothetical protein